MNGIEQSLLDDFDLVGDYSPGAGRRLKRISYTRDRLWLLSLGYGIFGGAPATPAPVYSHTFTAKPAAFFRPRRLVLQGALYAEDVPDPPPFPAYLNGDPLGLAFVRDIKIAAKSQFADPGGDPGNAPYHPGYSGNGYPAAGFRAEADDSLFKFDTCAPGREINVIVFVDDADKWQFNLELHVTAGMFGYSAGRE